MKRVLAAMLSLCFVFSASLVPAVSRDSSTTATGDICPEQTTCKAACDTAGGTPIVTHQTA